MPPCDIARSLQGLGDGGWRVADPDRQAPRQDQRDVGPGGGPSSRRPSEARPATQRDRHAADPPGLSANARGVGAAVIRTVPIPWAGNRRPRLGAARA